MNNQDLPLYPAVQELIVQFKNPDEIDSTQQQIQSEAENLLPIDHNLTPSQEIYETNLNPDAEEQSWLKRHMLKISVGAFVVGNLFSPINSTLAKVEHNAPWAISGALGSEAIWIAGAGLMAFGTGKKIGNPLTLRSRWATLKQETVNNGFFKTGLLVNSIGALGTAGVVASGAVLALPPESWPGALGIAAADIAGTIAIRKGIYNSLSANNRTTNHKPHVKVRQATLDDTERLADIDLKRFSGAYGESLPTKESVIENFKLRLQNSRGWMFVAEVDGQVEGFITAFRTNKAIDTFQSWEDSTANGTLTDKVDPKGKYGYIVNLTMNPKATETGADLSTMANVLAKGISEGLEYGYFVSRMPFFRRWINRKITKGELPADLHGIQLNKSALEYFNQTVKNKDGKTVRLDYELRMYEQSGFKLERVVPDAFEDHKSMNYGVVCKTDVTPNNLLMRKSKTARKLMSAGLKLIAKNPKLLKKVF
ncbi:MAG: hypothetical protein NVS1B7_7640 [Candidatus Saccharimonadales bacterium]